MTLPNRDKNIATATTIANGGDAIENDMIEAETEDDLQALLSHLEILERNVHQLRDNVRATLEGRTI